MNVKMRKRYFNIISLILIVTLLSGCGLPQSLNGTKPIEPIVPGVESGDALGFQGQFNIKSSGVQIHDLAVSASGHLTVVGTAARSLYLLEQDGKLRWERTLSSVPLQTYMDPAGRFLAVSTANGKVLVLEPDQKLRLEYNFESPVSILSVSGDGELILAGLTPDDPDEQDTLALINKMKTLVWQESFDELLDARIVGQRNRVLVNWITDGVPFIGAFSAEGEKLWELHDREQMAMDASGRTFLNTLGNEVLRYSDTAREIWAYAATGTVNRILVAENGHYFGVLVTDVSTQNQELHYFNGDGKEMWSKRLPNDSDILLSADGRRVVVASWRHFRDDATQIFIYNQSGEEESVLEVAGKTQKLALADEAGLLVLGLEDGSIYFLNIASAGSNQIMSTTGEERSLNDYYTPVSFGREEGESRLVLYFYDDMAQNLVPVTRRVKRSSSPTSDIIEELVRGPMQGSELYRTIPKDAVIQASITDYIVSVDLPVELDQMAGSAFLTGVFDSILLTISQFKNVNQIQFTVGGEEVPTFGQEGISIEGGHSPRPFGRKEGERLMFVPGQSGSRYYLLTESQSFLPLKDRALIQALVNYILEKSRSLYQGTLELQAVRIENNIVHLDFNETLNQLITQDHKAAARAAMLRDALALTILENAFFSSIQITVNGNPPKQPENYLPWDLTVTSPYQINLEE
jgi:spore germination protein GerM